MANSTGRGVRCAASIAETNSRTWSNAHAVSPDAVGLVDSYANKSAEAPHLWKLAGTEPAREAREPRVIPRKARQLTAAERRAFVEAYEQGEQLVAVAERLGVHRTTLDTLVKRLDLTREDPRAVPANVREEIVAAYRAGASLAELGVRYGFSANKVQRLLVDAGEPVRRRGPKGKGVPLHDARTRDVVNLYARGDSMGDIAELFGVSYAAVRAALIRAGVELRPRGGARC